MVVVSLAGHVALMLVSAIVIEQNHFLIVEDDKVMGRSVGAVFARFGQVQYAFTARQARAALAGEQKWTAVVLDVGLPDASGLDLLAELRERFPLLPAMVLTALFDRAIANRAQTLRAECVFKPASLENVKPFIHRALAVSCMPDVRINAVIENLAARKDLTRRETQLVGLSVAGVSREKVSRRLEISENTLKSLTRGLLKKCEADSLEALVRSILMAALKGSRVENRP